MPFFVLVLFPSLRYCTGTAATRPSTVAMRTSTAPDRSRRSTQHTTEATPPFRRRPNHSVPTPALPNAAPASHNRCDRHQPCTWHGNAAPYLLYQLLVLAPLLAYPIPSLPMALQFGEKCSVIQKYVPKLRYRSFSVQAPFVVNGNREGPTGGSKPSPGRNQSSR